MVARSKSPDLDGEAKVFEQRPFPDVGCILNVVAAVAAGGNFPCNFLRAILVPIVQMIRL